MWRGMSDRCDWSSIDDVRQMYPSADGVRNNHGAVVTVFNVKGGNYRLLTVIHYASRIVYEIDLLSHGDYDKSTWKEWQI